MKVKIIDIHEDDGWYGRRNELIGTIIDFEPDLNKYNDIEGYGSGWFDSVENDEFKHDCFYAVKVESIEESPKYRIYKPANEYRLIKGNENDRCEKCCFPLGSGFAFCKKIKITKKQTAKEMCSKKDYFIEV